MFNSPKIRGYPVVIRENENEIKSLQKNIFGQQMNEEKEHIMSTEHLRSQGSSAFSQSKERNNIAIPPQVTSYISEKSRVSTPREHMRLSLMLARDK